MPCLRVCVTCPDIPAMSPVPGNQPRAVGVPGLPRACYACQHVRHDQCAGREQGCVCFQCHARLAYQRPLAFSHPELAGMVWDAANRVSQRRAALAGRKWTGKCRFCGKPCPRTRQTCGGRCRKALSRARIAERQSQSGREFQAAAEDVLGRVEAMGGTAWKDGYVPWWEREKLCIRGMYKQVRMSVPVYV